jgi:hypothetical protein
VLDCIFDEDFGDFVGKFGPGDIHAVIVSVAALMRVNLEKRPDYLIRNEPCLRCEQCLALSESGNERLDELPLE